MAETPFNNDVSQAERRRIISEERAQRGVTFHQFGLLDQGPGGRFAKQEQKRSVTGEAAVPVYPALPESSPWRQWPPERGGDPLGVDVNEMVPVGSPAEIEASIRKLEAERLAEEDKSTAPDGLPASVETGLSSPTRRRRI